MYATTFNTVVDLLCFNISCWDYYVINLYIFLVIVIAVMQWTFMYMTSCMDGMCDVYFMCACVCIIASQSFSKVMLRLVESQSSNIKYGGKH